MMQNFPQDLLPHLFSFFKLEELYHILQFVCREWHNLCSLLPSSPNLRQGDEKQQQQSPSAISPWIAYHLSCFRNGTYFREFIRCDEEEVVVLALGDSVVKGSKSTLVWDDKHTEMIFSILERRIMNDYPSNVNEGILVKSSGIDEMIKSLQFLFLVHYDKELVKKILNDSSLTTDTCLYGVNEGFVGFYQSRVVNNLPNKENSSFMDMCYMESNLKGVDDLLFFYKLFERVFALDLDNDWTNVFPCIGKCSLLKKKIDNEHSRDLIRKMFRVELEVVLKMIVNICEWGFHQVNSHVLFSFSHFCKVNYSQYDTVVQLSESIVKEISRKAQSETFILTPILDRNTTDILETLENNKFINMHNKNETPLELIDFRSLYSHVACFLEFLYRKTTVGEMLKRTTRSAQLFSIQSKLSDYFVFQFVSMKDIEKRAQFLEKIEQALIYSVELKDFKTSFFFRNVLNNTCIHRLQKTSQLVERPSNFKNRLEESMDLLSADYNYRKLYQTFEKYSKESTIPM